MPAPRWRAGFTGPPTIVATGEARLESAAPTDPAIERVWPAPDVVPTSASAPPMPSEAPSHAPEAPSHVPEAPSHVPEAPSSLPEMASRAPETASRAPEVPSSPAAIAGGRSAVGDGGQSPPGDGGQSAAGAPSRRRRWPVIAGVVLLAGAAIAAIVIISSSSSSNPPAGESFASKLDPVPTNRVTASGTATVLLNGDVATVSVTANGLLNGAPHLMHIHAGGEGICPPASAATLHNGHLSMSTTNAGRFYGHPVVSLTTVGDTSPRSIIDFTRYPVGGHIRYRRTISLPPSVVTDIRENNAVIIVHGIDYNGNGVYDGFLGTSDLSNRLTEESTDPALCGPLAAARTVAGVGSGPAVYTASLTVNEALSRPGAMSDMSGMGAVAQTAGRSGAVTGTRDGRQTAGARRMSMPGMPGMPGMSAMPR